MLHGIKQRLLAWEADYQDSTARWRESADGRNFRQAIDALHTGFLAMQAQVDLIPDLPEKPPRQPKPWEWTPKRDEVLRQLIVTHEWGPHKILCDADALKNYPGDEDGIKQRAAELGLTFKLKPIVWDAENDGILRSKVGYGKRLDRIAWDLKTDEFAVEARIKALGLNY
jgi:hypothetical protein